MNHFKLLLICKLKTKFSIKNVLRFKFFFNALITRFRIISTVPPKENVILNSDGQVVEKVVGPIEEHGDLTLICEAFGKLFKN